MATKVKHRYGPWAGIVVVMGLLATASALWWSWRRVAPNPLKLGLAAYQRRHWHEASRMANRQLVLQPDDPEALRLAARSAIRSGQGELAQPIYAKLGPQAMQSEDFLLMGMKLTRMGQPEAAWAVIERVRGEDLDDPELLHELARLYASADRLSQGIEVVQRLATMRGWDVRAAVLWGLLCSAQSDPANTVAALSQALRRDPELREAPVSATAARKLLAQSLLQLGQPARAQEHLETVLARGPDPEAFWILSRARLQQKAYSDAEMALKRAEEYTARTTTVEPAPFVGAERCAKCHEGISRAQRSSRHAHTFARQAQLQNLPLPDDLVTDSGDPRIVHTLVHEDDQIVLKTNADGKLFRAVVEYAIGSEDRVRTPLVRNEHGQVFECRLSRYARGADGAVWEKSSGQPDELTNTEESLGRLLTADALRRCLHCHATDVIAARDGAGPAAGDQGIGCERCHGPGGNHVLAVAGGFSDLAIARPQSAPGVLRLCGQCHSPRGGAISSDDPSAVRFQAAGLLRSRCYTASEGKLDCITCHDPHSDAASSATFYESKCLECHGSVANLPTEPPAVQSTPCPVNSKADCLGCHMPPAERVMPHSSFTDHEIRIPK